MTDEEMQCACAWTDRGLDDTLCPLHALAEAQGRQHAEYHAEAARLAGGGEP